MRELEYPFDANYIITKKKKLRKALKTELEKTGGIHKNIAILGGSTTNDIKLVLELFLLNHGIEADFYESEYNQYYQDAMFPNSELEAFAPDIIYICTSNRNVLSYPQCADSVGEIDVLLNKEVKHYTEMWERLREVYHCPIIQNNFEMPFYRLLGNRDAWDVHGATNFLTRLNMAFYEYAQEHDNFYICDLNYIAADYGLKEWAEPYYWYMYKYAMAVPAIPYLSFNVANIIKSVFGKNKKALALDLDNTLWGGIIGEDGVENIEMGQETSSGQMFDEFQSYLKKQSSKGILLTINSKNDIDVALSGFERPDAVLRKDDFVAVRANWESKDINLRNLAEELKLLPDSFVFVDDNPAERHMVREAIPETAVPELNLPEHYIQIIDRGGYFETTSISSDDLNRNAMYQQNAQRRQAQGAFSDYGDYLKSLNMMGTIRTFDSLYLSRIAQLTNKSNQFNLTTRRYSQAELEQIACDQEYITLYGKLEDCFGDNGVVSTIIGKRTGNELHIDLWLMSCRVLKRDMEFAMMDELVQRCKAMGLSRIIGYYFPTAKNGMVKDFYKLQGFTKIKEDEEGNTVWEFLIDDKYEKKNHYIEVNSHE